MTMPSAARSTPAMHWKAAVEAMRAQDLATAAQHCDAALARAPDHAAALHLRAIIHLRLQEHGSAEQCALRAIACGPGQPGAHCTLGQACRAQQRPDEAVHHFQDALNLDPGHVESLVGLAGTLALLGRATEAKDAYRRLVALRPGMAVAHYNLGRAHEDAGEPVDAARCYRRALALDPGLPYAWLNLGGVLAQLGEVAEAGAALRRAVALRPDYAAAHNSLGTVLHGMGDVEAAAASFGEAIRCDRTYAEAHQNLGSALALLGRKREAEAALEEALRLNPAYARARYNLGVVRGENPPRPPADVIRSLFDDYATRFDTHLVDHLGYRVPERLAAQIAALRAEGGRLDVLDLGCGTGLFGAAIRPLAQRLTGVDISPRMLEKARERGGYDRLEVADVEAFLCGEPAQCYDLVAATDVFIYVGAIDGVVAEVARVLRSGGLFAFSVETPAAPTADAYLLQASGRYAHDPAYLQRLAERCGLALRVGIAEPIRRQSRVPVPGWIAVFAK